MSLPFLPNVWGNRNLCALVRDTILEGKDKLTEYRFNTKQAALFLFNLRNLYFSSKTLNPTRVWSKGCLH